jgi:hypothetical protein
MGIFRLVWVEVVSGILRSQNDEFGVVLVDEGIKGNNFGFGNDTPLWFLHDWVGGGDTHLGRILTMRETAGEWYSPCAVTRGLGFVSD